MLLYMPAILVEGYLRIGGCRLAIPGIPHTGHIDQLQRSQSLHKGDVMMPEDQDLARLAADIANSLDSEKT